MDQDEKMGEIKNLGKEKKVIKTSTGLVIIFAAAVLFVGGALTYWYYNDPNSYFNSTDATVVATTSNSNTNSSETADWKTYSNTNFDFSLALNDAFSGYAVKEVPSTSFQTRFIQFYLPTTDASIKTDATLGGKYANVFNIVVYTPAQWATVQAAGDADTILLKGSNTYMNKNDNYVFAYTKPSITASDLASKKFDITTVASSFKFVSSLTSGWKLYTNLDNGFSFKYPNNWFVGDYTFDGRQGLYISNYPDGYKYDKSNSPNDLLWFTILPTTGTIPGQESLIKQEVINNITVYSLRSPEDLNTENQNRIYIKEGAFVSKSNKYYIYSLSPEKLDIAAELVKYFDLLIPTFTITK